MFVCLFDLCPMYFCLFGFFFLLSLDQLLASAGDQQRLQAVLSSVGSKSPILTLIQEAKAQSVVSGMHKTQGWNGRALVQWGRGRGWAQSVASCTTASLSGWPLMRWEMLDRCHCYPKSPATTVHQPFYPRSPEFAKEMLNDREPLSVWT